MLGRNAVHPLKNAQQREELKGELYRRREEQIIQKARIQNSREEYQNRGNQYRGTETGLGPMAVD